MPASRKVFTASATSGLWRVHHAHQSQESQALLDALWCVAPFARGQLALRQRQHAQDVAGVFVVDFQDFFACRRIQRHFFPVDQDVAAQLQHLPRRAFDKSHLARVV